MGIVISWLGLANEYAEKNADVYFHSYWHYDKATSAVHPTSQFKSSAFSHLYLNDHHLKQKWNYLRYVFR